MQLLRLQEGSAMDFRPSNKARFVINFYYELAPISERELRSDVTGCPKHLGMPRKQTYSYQIQIDMYKASQ
jgi:hypothetical protein